MKSNVRLGLILLLALGLRLVSLNQSLWLDEAIQAQAVIINSLPKLFTDYLPNDFNPPLSYLISWFAVRVFGENEIWLRLPSVLLGVGNIWLVYRLAQTIFPKGKYVLLSFRFTLSQLAALLLATAPLHLYYSQEARPYVLASFLATWSMYELWRLVNIKRPTKWRYLMATMLMLYSHYMTWLLLPAQALIVVLSKKKQAVTHWVIATVSLSILLVPWLPTLLRQLKAGTSVAQALPVWKQLGELSVKNLSLVPVKFLLGRIAIGNDFMYGLVAGILVLGVGWLLIFSLLQKNKEKERAGFLWLWLVAPVMLGVLLSIKVPIFQYFRFLFVLPAFYLLLTLGIASLPKRFQGLVFGGVLALNLVSSGIYLFSSQFHREDWRSAVAFIDQRDPEPVVVILRPVGAPFWYYNRGRAKTFDYSEIDQVRFEKRVWLITYAQPIFEPENVTAATLEQYGFEKVITKDFRGVGVTYLVNPAGLTAAGQ